MCVHSKDELARLNYEYSPSEHTKRYRTAEEAIQGHIKLIEKGNYCHYTIFSRFDYR